MDERRRSGSGACSSGCCASHFDRQRVGTALRPGKLLNTSNKLVNGLVSGWENSVIFQYQSGWPSTLPANAFYVKDATLDSIDWSKPLVKGFATCAARWNDNGTITMVPASVSAGCTDYNWLVAPRYGPTRNSGPGRPHPPHGTCTDLAQQGDENHGENPVPVPRGGVQYY